MLAVLFSLWLIMANSVYRFKRRQRTTINNGLDEAKTVSGIDRYNCKTTKLYSIFVSRRTVSGLKSET